MPTSRRARRPTVLTVVGARPQFVKAAPLARALERRVRHLLVHTGQHYDPEMSGAFFDELGLPAPHRDLGVGSGPHGAMTGRMLEALERVMLEDRPDLVLVMGDTNSTLAGALAAAKLGLPLAHVEAGLRSHDGRMPEEINRRVTDHVSQLLFCPTTEAVANLRREGLRAGVHRVGDVMMDAVVQNRARAAARATRPAARSYFVATLHRQENVDDPVRLRRLMVALRALPRRTLVLVHPRTRERLRAQGIGPGGALDLRGPASYLETLHLVEGAQAVLTDSGGLQKEAFILRTPCVTLRDTTEWVETIQAGANVLVGADPDRIRRAVEALERRRPTWRTPRVYGDGRASEKIAQAVARFCRERA